MKKIPYNKKQNTRHKINRQIGCAQVRLVGWFDQPEVIKTIEAIKIAESEGLDLILINENQDPPPAKIEDYKKFIYNIEKLEKEKKKNANKSVIKEIKLSVDIAENDMATKSRKAIEFLKNGDRVKCTLQLKGRQKSSPERGEITMLKFFTMIGEFGISESLPAIQSSTWTMMIKPKKK